MVVFRRLFQGTWRRLWSALPDWLQPLRITLAGLLRKDIEAPLRKGIEAPPSGRYDPEDRRGYAAWLAVCAQLNHMDRAAIRTHIATLPAEPLISLAMPVSTVAPDRLRAAILSVQAQAWPHWELCIAADAAAPPRLRSLVKAAAKADARIRLTSPPTGDTPDLVNAALAEAAGVFAAVLAPDAQLAQEALYEVAVAVAAQPDLAVLYSDEDCIDAGGQRYKAWFKSAFDADLLLGCDVLGGFAVYRCDLLRRLGGMRRDMGHAAAHDLALRATRAVGSARIRHIPALLLHAAPPEPPDFAAHAKAIAAALAEAGIAAQVEPAPLVPGGIHVVRPVPEPAPLVSVIIPTRDHAQLLANCVEGVLHRTDYPAMELLIVDNDSQEAETFALFERLATDPRVRILPSPGPFNYSRLNNRAVAEARGTILLLLNNDVEVMGPDWLREMVSHAVRPEIGAVGAKLLYADGTLQHGGLVTGVGGLVNYYMPRVRADDPGYFGSLGLVREVGAVTGACLALRREVFMAVGGLDEVHLAVAFNDVDLCLRIREAGWRILWTPFAELYHLESASRGLDLAPEKAQRLAGEGAALKARWNTWLLDDPFYSPWLSLEGAHGALAQESRRQPPWRPLR